MDRWEERATADADRVARFWPSPLHNVGIACGPSRLVVLDLDTHDPLPQEWRLPGLVDGCDVLAQLCEWAGQPWPSTHMVMTPLGGWHLYYAAAGSIEIRNSSAKLGPSIDVRAAGGYVLGAGSVVDERAYPDRTDLAGRVRGGRAYGALDDDPAAPLPAWLRNMLVRPSSGPRSSPSPRPRSSPPGRLAGLVRTVETAQAGQRNDTLYWATRRAAEMAADGEVGAHGAAAFLLSAATAAGLPEHEARRTIASAMGR